MNENCDFPVSVSGRKAISYWKPREIRMNKRLKIGILRLPKNEHISSVPLDLLPEPSSVTSIFSENTLKVLKEIATLGEIFYRGSLTKNMRNTAMNAEMIKEHLSILVSKGVLEEVTSPRNTSTAGRPKSEQYKVLWTEEAINVFFQEDEGCLEPLNTIKKE